MIKLIKAKANKLIIKVDRYSRVMTKKQINDMYSTLRRGGKVLVNPDPCRSSFKIQERTRQRLLYTLQEYKINDLIKTLKTNASKHFEVPENKVSVTIKRSKKDKT